MEKVKSIESLIRELDWEKENGLIPCIIQDVDTLKVLMMGYMTKESLLETAKEKKIVFFSRSRQKLWMKGEESGNKLELVDLSMDCDKDTLLAWVKPKGPVCHTGADTCWNEKNVHSSPLRKLERTIQERKANPSDQSYTASLLKKGINKVAQKVGEEAVELVIEAKDDNEELFLNEAADLMYHYLVLLAAKGFKLKDVEAVLKGREK